MADLSIQNLTDEDGAEVTFAAAAAGGDKFIWDARAFLIIKNDDASPTTVTLTAVTTSVTLDKYGELTRSNIALAVGAGEVAVIPPVPEAFRNAADAGKVAITYSSVTDLSVAVARIS